MEHKPALIALCAPIFVAACAPVSTAQLTAPSTTPADSVITFQENAIEVPGFADFLALDGDTVWTTNDGRVEQWSTTAKVASVTMPKPCGTMAMAFGSLWVANCDGGEVYRINPETAQIIARIPAGMGPSGELNVVAGAGSIWAPNQTTGQIARIDPDTNSVSATIDAAQGTSYLAFGFDALWAVSGPGNLLQRVSPQSNLVTHSIPLGETPGFLAAGEGAVWVQEQSDGTLARIDPDTVQVAARTKVGDNLKWGDIDTGDGKVWLRTTDDQTFVVIDAATNAIIARVGPAEGSGALRYTAAGVWTSAHDVHSLTWWTQDTE
ncbi:MAG: YncE family protein [Alteraurantiacibacter sp.]